MNRPKQSEPTAPPDTLEQLLVELGNARTLVRVILGRIADLAEDELHDERWRGSTHRPAVEPLGRIAESLGGGKDPGPPPPPPPPPPKRRASKPAATLAPLGDNPGARQILDEHHVITRRMDATACTDSTLEFVRNSDIPVAFSDLASHGAELGHALRAVRAALNGLCRDGKVRTVGAGKAVRYELVTP